MEEEGRKEPDKVQGQCRVGISFTRITEYTQALCNALLTIPIQAWSRVGLIFIPPQKYNLHTFSVGCGIKSLPFWECKSALPAMEPAEI